MFELSVAKKHITSDPKMVLFAVLSVALSVGIIVAMMGLMEGYRDEIVSSTVENYPHLTITPKQDEDYITLYRSVSRMALAFPEVLAVSPRLLGKAGAKYRDEVRGVAFIGANPLQEEPLMNVRKDMAEGDYYDLVYRKRAAVLGTKLAQELGIEVGDRLTLVRQNRSLKVEVAGLIRTGTGSDQILVYLPLETAQDLLGEGDVVSEVGVRLSDIYAAPAIVSHLNQITSYRAKSWQDQSKDILEVLETQKIFMWIFYGLMFLIALLVVANTMIMIVRRRIREIGILMAMGATRWSIAKIFLLESIFLGPPAALVGCVLAYATAKAIEAYPIEVPSEVYMVSRMKVYLIPEMYLYAVAFVLAVNFAAGIYPAFRASRLDPVEAIGSE